MAIADRPTVVAGDPLMVTVTITNHSSTKLLVRTDGDGILRSIVGPEGARAEYDNANPPGDSTVFLNEVAPGTAQTVRFTATETIRLSRPGEYRMTLEYPPLGISGELLFTVKPYDRAALRVRAEELHDRLLGPDDEWELDEVALTAMDPSITKPLICDLLLQNHMSLLLPRRLEEIGDAQSVNCLIAALPRSVGMQREAMTWGLKRLLSKVKDTDLRERIREALPEN
jgi:hypothetical protein